jgi:hypothetical protein
MSDFFKLLATFKPPDKLLAHLHTYKTISPEAQRWLSVWEHWDSWVIELEKRMTDDDERLLRELVSLFDTEVKITEVKQATLLDVPDKVTI